MSTNEKPKIVYKYVGSINILESILKNHSIRLNDIQESNDTTELKLIYSIIKTVFYEEYEKDKPLYLEKYFNKQQFEDFYIQNTKYINQIENVIHTQYASCFSRYGDLLSQWRGYADDGKGLSIGFSTKYFKKETINLIGFDISKDSKKQLLDQK